MLTSHLVSMYLFPELYRNTIYGNIFRETIWEVNMEYTPALVKSPQRQNLLVFFLDKWLIYVEKLSPFSLFALCASDLVHILLHSGTFHAHYTNHKN